MRRLPSLLAGGVVAVWAVVALSADDQVEFVDFDATVPVSTAGLKFDWQAMEYASPQGVRGIQKDWNNDGCIDTLIVSDESLCGTGGCNYELFDGKSGRSIGQFFGRPLFIHSQRINGWPVISMYGHSSAESGSYTGMVFDGSQYVTVFGVFLSGQSVDELFQGMSKMRRKEERP